MLIHDSNEARQISDENYMLLIHDSNKAWFMLLIHDSNKAWFMLLIHDSNEARSMQLLYNLKEVHCTYNPNDVLNTHMKCAGPRNTVGGARGPGFDTQSSHILSLLLSLIQEGQLSVTGESR